MESGHSAVDVDAMHRVQLANLKELDRVCKKHNIKYYLAFGTLIGAIRNNGIIPWDDDIDVVMKREDYDRLKKLDVKEWKESYFLQSIDSDPECGKCYMKLRDSSTTLIEKYAQNKDINHGISIDIYSLIHLADDLNLRKKQLRYSLGYMLLTENHPAQNHGLMLKLASGFVLSIIPPKMKKWLRSRCEQHMLAYQAEDTECSFVLSGLVALHRSIKNTYFENAIPHKFEDSEFLIPSGYDDWLSTVYGNYMQEPPIEKRNIKLDGFALVDVNKPYTDYKGKYYLISK